MSMGSAQFGVGLGAANEQIVYALKKQPFWRYFSEEDFRCFALVFNDACDNGLWDFAGTS